MKTPNLRDEYRVLPDFPTEQSNRPGEEGDRVKSSNHSFILQSITIILEVIPVGNMNEPERLVYNAR